LKKEKEAKYIPIDSSHLLSLFIFWLLLFIPSAKMRLAITLTFMIAPNQAEVLVLMGVKPKAK